jgi:hypothetical protein
MAFRDGEVNLSYEELEALCGERETILHTLRQQVHAREAERDQALRGLELLTEALRRRGCCDHDTSGSSF